MVFFKKNKDKEKDFVFLKTKYSINTKCKNCGNKEELKLPRGTKVEEYLKEQECKKCGVKSLIKRSGNSDDFFSDSFEEITENFFNQASEGEENSERTLDIRWAKLNLEFKQKNLASLKQIDDEIKKWNKKRKIMDVGEIRYSNLIHLQDYNKFEKLFNKLFPSKKVDQKHALKKGENVFAD